MPTESAMDRRTILPEPELPDMTLPGADFLKPELPDYPAGHEPDEVQELDLELHEDAFQYWRKYERGRQGR